MSAWLGMLRGLPWRLVGYAVAAAAAIAAALVINGWRLDSRDLEVAQAALDAEQRCEPGTRCAARFDALAADGAAAVEEARQAAQEAAHREQARVASEGQAAVERARAAAAEARAVLLAAQAKLDAAIAGDTSCATYAKEPIRCDY